MTTRRPERDAVPRRREPIHNPLIWIGVALSLALVIPWWAPKGAIEPFVLGVPWWFAISFVGTVLLSAVASWACLRGWNLVEPEEEAALAAERGEDGGAR